MTSRETPWPMPVPCAGTPQRTPHGITIRKRNRMRVHPGGPGRPGVLTCSIRRLFPVLSLGSLPFLFAFEHPARDRSSKNCDAMCGAGGRPGARRPRVPGAARPGAARSRVRSGWHGPPARSRHHEHGVECTAPHDTQPSRSPHARRGCAHHTRGVGVLITRTCARLFTRRAHHGPEMRRWSAPIRSIF